METNQQTASSSAGATRLGGGEAGERIGRQVMALLGNPDQLYRVDVWPLWGEHYRVNVLVSAGLATARIAHSFFVSVNSTGEIVTSAPLITRRYGIPVEMGDHAEIV
jgi:hypothetical protein